MANPIVTITMEDGSVMKAELYPDVAPNTRVFDTCLIAQL
jgi:peptidyl-prolyl cis-trans isomerase B (cyclophilin B)